LTGTSSYPLSHLSLQPTLLNLPERLPTFDPSRHLNQYGETITAVPFDSSPLVLPSLLKETLPVRLTSEVKLPHGTTRREYAITDVEWKTLDATPFYLPLSVAKMEFEGKEETWLLEATTKRVSHFFLGWFLSRVASCSLLLIYTYSIRPRNASVTHLVRWIKRCKYPPFSSLSPFFSTDQRLIAALTLPLVLSPFLLLSPPGGSPYSYVRIGRHPNPNKFSSQRKLRQLLIEISREMGFPNWDPTADLPDLVQLDFKPFPSAKDDGTEDLEALEKWNEEVMFKGTAKLALGKWMEGREGRAVLRKASLEKKGERLAGRMVQWEGKKVEKKD